ncbi:MAG: hypothetical protein ACLQOZ_08400 [Acidimicrobiales bacterium]
MGLPFHFVAAACASCFSAHCLRCVTGVTEHGRMNGSGGHGNCHHVGVAVILAV